MSEQWRLPATKKKQHIVIFAFTKTAVTAASRDAAHGALASSSPTYPLSDHGRVLPGSLGRATAENQVNFGLGALVHHPRH